MINLPQLSEKTHVEYAFHLAAPPCKTPGFAFLFPGLSDQEICIVGKKKRCLSKHGGFNSDELGASMIWF
jgi:hypothetical protein